MSFRHIADAFPPCKKGQSQSTIESSAFLPKLQLGQAAPEDLVYLPNDDSRGRTAGYILISMTMTK